MNALIAIVDYGAGNLRSVSLALERLGAPCLVTRDPARLAAADGLILPGVGAFGDAAAALHASGLVPALLAFAASGRPFLGVCLGMQLLFESSEETPGAAGLGLIPGQVRRLPDRGLKIPHIGWNDITPVKAGPLLAGLGSAPYVYFVHSYACLAHNPAHVLATATYGVPFHAAVQRDNLFGVQFHPEKSGGIGERILRNFTDLLRHEGDPL